MNRLSTILTIAATDPSGGAGIAADVKTAMLCGVHACAAVTAVTVQNSLRFSEIQPVAAELLHSQLESIAEDADIAAVKIGMIPTAELIDVTAAFIRERGLKNIVIDPILSATVQSTADCGDASVPEYAARTLYPLADVLTPNLPEAARLLSLYNRSLPESPIETAAVVAESVGCRGVLLKGGHGSGDAATDAWFDRQTQSSALFVARRLDAPNSHGTGCTLSSAIAAGFAKGESPEASIGNAERLVRELLKAGAGYTYGRGGYGPLGFSELSKR